MKTEIIPSILEPTKARFVERYRVVSSRVKIAQLDVLDNTFLPFSNFHDPDFIAGLHPVLDFEIHFMTRNVLEQLPEWGYPWVKKILFHYEAVPHPAALIALAKELGKGLGVVINPETDPAQIKTLLSEVDCVQAMTVHPGQNAAAFVPAALSHIRQLREMDKKLAIEVDGGMNPDTLKQCRQAGANLFVVGSYLKNDEFDSRLKKLNQALE